MVIQRLAKKVEIIIVLWMRGEKMVINGLVHNDTIKMYNYLSSVHHSGP